MQLGCVEAVWGLWINTNKCSLLPRNDCGVCMLMFSGSSITGEMDEVDAFRMKRPTDDTVSLASTTPESLIVEGEGLIFKAKTLRTPRTNDKAAWVIYDGGFVKHWATFCTEFYHYCAQMRITPQYEQNWKPSRKTSRWSPGIWLWIRNSWRYIRRKWSKDRMLYTVSVV